MADVQVGSVSVAVDSYQKMAKRREKKLRNEPSSVISETLPASLQVVDFAEARATEMRNLLTAVKKKEVGKRTFQRLPRHMRRRAMSHNLKRLPRRVREKAAKEMESTKGDKKPCRKKRRRPRMLEKEYRSRQRDKSWLETHIWHAKRMKMVNKWSYRLAEHCSSKGVRATYRYLRNGCLLSDISYYSCVEVAGTEESIKLHLGKFFAAKTGLTPLAKTFLSGTREGEAIMYHCGGYPDKPVGPVMFLWKPLVEISDKPVAVQLDIDSCVKDVAERKLWIWVHPSIYDEVLQILQEGVSDKKVSVTSLRDELLRFRLLGPLAHQLLMKSLHPATTVPASKETMKEEKEEECDEIKYLKGSCKWEEIVATSFDRKWWMTDDEYACQAELFHSYQPTISALLTPGDFIPGTAFGVTVLDPRVFLPRKRMSLVSPLAQKPPKYPRLHLSEIIGEELVEDEELAMIEDSPFAFPEPQIYDEEEDSSSEPDDSIVHDAVDGRSKDDGNMCQATLINGLPSQMSCSPLWRRSVRQSVSCSKIQDCVINEVRSEFLLKPSELNLSDESSRIPIVVIEKTYQRPSSCPLSLSLPHVTGCDLVLPSCWGMAFWMTLVYNGGRACGMKELRSASLESLLPIFPADFPDTLSGIEAANEERKALECKYHRYPPDKRPNFGKIAIKTPFHSPWLDLVNTWERQVASDLEDSQEDEEVNTKKIKLDTEANSQKNESFYVLRDKEALRRLETFIVSVLQAPSKITRADLADLVVKGGIDSIVENHSNAIVTVSLQTAVHGSIPPHSTISLPTTSDLSTFMSNQRYPGPLEIVAPRGLTITGRMDEGLQIGISQLARKDIKKERRKQKKKLKDTSSSNAATLFQLREVVPSRETIGFIGTTAGYRHSSSHYAAIGHCALRGLVEAIKIAYLSYSKQLVVLTRGHSRQYRYALIALVN